MAHLFASLLVLSLGPWKRAMLLENSDAIWRELVQTNISRLTELSVGSKLTFLNWVKSPLVWQLKTLQQADSDSPSWMLFQRAYCPLVPVNNRP